jgi:carbohydrate-binding DOMON domain-containing protein
VRAQSRGEVAFHPKSCYHITTMKKISLILMLLFLFVSSSFAQKSLFKIDDPVGDDYGPGSYVYARNPVFKPGSFDLTGFEVLEDENDVIFKIYFKNLFYPPPNLQISNEKNLDNMFDTDLFLQNIDIYIDMDHKYNSGISEAIPGRNVTISSESAWEKAIFISGQPRLAREEMRRLAKKIDEKVIVPLNYEVKDDFCQVRISKKDLGQPDETWGYVVLITAAEWEASLFSLTRWFRHVEEPVLNRIVEKFPGEWVFGGSDSESAPNVMDMLAPERGSQEKMLKSYDKKTKELAQLTALYPYRKAMVIEKVGPEIQGGVKVLDVMGKIVTIDAGKEVGIYVGKLGQIYDGRNALVATIIVDEVREKVSVCSVVPMTQTAEIAAGMQVRFK